MEVVSKLGTPTDVPTDERQHAEWQEANRTWWNKHPMRYDWREPIEYEEFSEDFHKEIDRRFFSCVHCFMPWREIPFDPLIDFESLATKDVLEIGTGNGSHAQLISQHAKSYTGIDITSYAVKSTTERLKRLGLDRARIMEMDAENIEFPDNSFDFIWSWGVIHASANTDRVLQEMNRVLRPGGHATIMVYHCGWWNYYFVGTVFHGILQGGLFRTGSLAKTIQEHTDGAIGRYYSPRTMRAEVSPYFDVPKIQVFGAKAELPPIPGGRFKSLLLRAIPNSFGRFLTNRCRMGSFLVSELQSRK